MEDQNYTIKDIARMAGVSAGTVDRVLHNRGDVSPKSKAKVQKVLDEIHYQPNVFAIGLAAKKKYSFLCLIPYYIEHDYWHSVVGGIERVRQELRPFNVSIDYLCYHHGDEKSYQEACLSIKEKNVDAVLISPNFREETLALTAYLQENKIAYAFDKINNVAVGTVNAQQVTLNKAVVYKDKALANSELKATASYSILDAMTAYTSSGNDETTLKAIKKAFTVESSKFTVKLQTIFDGGKIVFYKDNAVVTGTVGIDADGKIAGLTKSSNKKQGLAINFLSADLAVNSTNVADSYPSDDANKLQGYAFGNSNAAASDKQIKVTWSTGIPTVTVKEDASGLVFENSDSSSPTYETTLTATFEDATGIVYTSSIKVEKK